MYHYSFNGSPHEPHWRTSFSGFHKLKAPPQITSAVILFTDIVGYTEHCETLDPQEAFLLLSDFYQRTSEAAALHNAAITDHFGDEVLAVWKGKAPLAVQAFRALRCGFAILVEMERWNEWRRKSHLRPVNVGIGIHAGPVLLGEPQSERGGPNVFGDTVNIASRLERQTRNLRTDIVISEELFQLIADVAGDTALLDHFPSTISVTLSGRAKPLHVRPGVLRHGQSRFWKEDA